MLNYFYTVFWAMMPFTELRLAIPLAYLKFGLPIIEATLTAIAAGIVLTMVILWILPPAVRFFEKHIPIFHRIMEKIFEKTLSKYSRKMALLGEIFLVLFVSIPLPGSGAWSGSLVAFLFGVRYWTAVKLISAGVVISGIIVAILTLGGQEAWQFLSEAARKVTL